MGQFKFFEMSASRGKAVCGTKWRMRRRMSVGRDWKVDIMRGRVQD